MAAQWFVFDFITAFLTVLLTFYLFSSRLGYKKKNAIVPVLGAFILFGILCILMLAGAPADVRNLAGVALFVAYACLGFLGSAAKKVAWGCAASFITMIAYALAILLGRLLGFGSMPPHEETVSNVYIEVTYLLLAAVICVVAARAQSGTKGAEIRMHPVQAACTVAITALSALLLGGVALVLQTGAGESVPAPAAIKIGLCATGVAAALILFIIGYGQARMREHEARLDAKQTRLERDYYRHNDESSKSLRGLRHDIASYIHVMKKLVDQGNHSELREYFDSIEKKYQKSKTVFVTDNTVLNAMLTAKIEEASEHGIDIKLKYNTSRQIPLSYADYCSLFGNMLDNAIEANRKLPEGEARYIDIVVGDKGDMVYIKIENASDGEYRYDDGELRTTKEGGGHGIGLKRVRAIAESIGGFFDVSAGPDQFMAIAMLPPERKDAEDG